MSKSQSAKDAHTNEHLATPTDLKSEGVRDISAALGGLLADVFTLYMKTKNFHWHMSGPHFRDFHLLLDEQGAQLFEMTDPIAERARKIGGMALKSIGSIARQQRIKDNDADFVEPIAMLAELRDDNKQLVCDHARRARRLRRIRRRRDREPAGELDRRDRTPHVVPVRVHPWNAGREFVNDRQPGWCNAEGGIAP